ncbi:MAG: hypothetical protein ACRDT0_19640 [Pseudonocardiaceae bacterium]
MTSATPQLLLELPGDLAAVRLDAAGDSLDTQARRLVDQMVSSGRSVGDVEQTVRGVVDTLDMLGTLNVQLTGKFAVPTSEGPVTATVVLAVHPLQVNDRRAAAEDLTGLASAIREIVQRRNPYADMRVVTLPAGPAAVSVVSGTLRLPAEWGGGQEVAVPTYRVQFLIPLPTGEHLLALDVSTTSERGWPAIARQAVAAARSVRFDDAR